MATNQNVLIDREKYIGGSEISAILNISKFTTRDELLLEKAGLLKKNFKGNPYTRYGDEMEGKIRNFLNKELETNFIEDTIIKELDNGIIDLRCNYDGLDRDNKLCLEIKTTSDTHEKLSEYKYYLVQLLYGMYLAKYDKGYLAVYERPSNMSKRFDKTRLMLFEVKIENHKETMFEILEEIGRFIKDLEELKQSAESETGLSMGKTGIIMKLSNEIEIIEDGLKAFKELKEKRDNLCNELYNAMESYNVDKWVTPNGTTISKIKAVESEIELVEEFDMELFKKENMDLYNKYIKTVAKTKNGKKGYVRVTLKKEKEGN